ncbi:hypothetical protein ACV367_33445, partial [Pseudomonas aeruginosa]
PPATVALPAAQDRDQPFELSSVQQAYWLGPEGSAGDRRRSAPAASGGVDARTPPPLSCFDLQDWRTLQVDEAERDWQALRDWRAHECLAVERGQVFLLGLVRMPGGEERLWLSL